jgi:hypothetical protein
MCSAAYLDLEVRSNGGCGLRQLDRRRAATTSSPTCARSCPCCASTCPAGTCGGTTCDKEV